MNLDSISRSIDLYKEITGQELATIVMTQNYFDITAKEILSSIPIMGEVGDYNGPPRLFGFEVRVIPDRGRFRYEIR